MGFQNFHAQGDRIVRTIVPVQQIRYLSCSGTRDGGQMAPTLRRKYLVCFYCNKKSGIQYDGLIQQWECNNCESMNYLDETGEITDPPVATYDAAPVTRSFAITRSESPPSSQEPDTSLFCSTCLKNQHLFTASLAQYDVDIDPSSPHYKENERDYYRYRNGLEKRYPQVCEDCEPKVLEQMREAGRTAKTDYLRRLMEKSRARRSAGHIRPRLLPIETIGKLLWYLGLLGHLLWHIIALVRAAQHHHPLLMEPFTRNITSLPSYSFFNGVMLLSKASLARSSLLCSAASVWWNPKFKQMKNGFMTHIQGFGDWYKYQALLFAIRGLSYFIVGTGVLADPYASSTVTAHAFILGFVTYLAIAAHSSLKIDMTSLWTTPEKLQHVGPRTSPAHTNNAMEDALNELSGSPSQRGPYQFSPPYTSPPKSYHRATRRTYETSKPDIQSTYGITKRDILLQPRNRSPPSDSQNDVGPMVEEMDWSPSQSMQSQQRAFALTKQNSSELFSQTPIEPQNSPFWYKVPPAPISLAHQLRNPPNQPRLRVSSQEVKENFFNNVTRRTPLEGTLPPNVPRRDIEFAQQTFFPPAPPSEAGNSLADLMNSFTLTSVGDEVLTPTRHKSRSRHLCQGVILLLGVVFWNQVAHQPSEQTTNVLLAIMAVCVILGVRTVVDNSIFADHKEQNATARIFRMGLGIGESLAALYGIVKILAKREDCADCASLGTILIGGMMVHEIWLASFG